MREANRLRVGVMIGGASARMGEAKHLLAWRGEPLLLRYLSVLDEAGMAADGDDVALLGGGVTPALPYKCERIDDWPNARGPLAAALAAHLRRPSDAWILLACDHPWLDAASLRWLMSQRCDEYDAVIPVQEDGVACPTFALYEAEALRRLLRRAEAGDARGLAALLEDERTHRVRPPVEFIRAWRNVNTPEQYVSAIAESQS